MQIVESDGLLFKTWRSWRVCVSWVFGIVQCIQPVDSWLNRIRRFLAFNYHWSLSGLRFKTWRPPLVWGDLVNTVSFHKSWSWTANTTISLPTRFEGLSLERGDDDAAAGEANNDVVNRGASKFKTFSWVTFFKNVTWIESNHSEFDAHL